MIHYYRFHLQRNRTNSKGNYSPKLGTVFKYELYKNGLVFQQPHWIEEQKIIMKELLLCVLTLISTPAFAKDITQNSAVQGKITYAETLGLAKPLLLLVGSKGFLGCGYINVDACNKTKEACAIVTGVSNEADMEKAEIKQVSDEAKKLGVKVGMLGKDAIKLLE